MITLNSPDKSLAEARNFAHTQASGLIYPTMTAELFTSALQRNVQRTYEFVSNLAQPLTIEDLKQAHEDLCGGLQTIGGQINQEEVQKYEESCKILLKDFGAVRSSYKEEQNWGFCKAIGEHAARCEALQIFPDHNSLTHRIILEASMDMVLDKAQRPAIDQNHYERCIAGAQRGDSQMLTSLILNNHSDALEAKQGLSMEKTQKVGPDISTFPEPQF